MEMGWRAAKGKCVHAHCEDRDDDFAMKTTSELMQRK